MYVLNRSGSATEPCQTPDFTGQEKRRGPQMRTAVSSGTKMEHKESRDRI